MDVYIRVDASVVIGAGHVMRCLTLADQLRRRGAQVSFLCREFPGNLCNLIVAKGYRVWRLPFSPDTAVTAEQNTWLGADWRQDAQEVRALLARHPVDWLVVDHYAIDRRWEVAVRDVARRIMVIDDLANRVHDCDILLDQNLFRDMEKRYDGLVPERCRRLLGPRYALLRPEFWVVRRHVAPRDGIVRRLLVFFGGSDPTNETAKALAAIKILGRPDLSVDVVTGTINPRQDEIKRLCAALPGVNFHCQVADMATLMARSDLALGAGGTATWERCCLGLPALTVVVAANQAEVTAALTEVGAVYNLGWHEQVTPQGVADALTQVMAAPALLRHMSRQAFAVMSGGGEEVADIMCREVG